MIRSCQNKHFILPVSVVKKTKKVDTSESGSEVDLSLLMIGSKNRKEVGTASNLSLPVWLYIAGCQIRARVDASLV